MTDSSEYVLRCRSFPKFKNSAPEPNHTPFGSIWSLVRWDRGIFDIRIQCKWRYNMLSMPVFFSYIWSVINIINANCLGLTFNWSTLYILYVFIMVAHSSVARTRGPLYFAVSLFSLNTLPQKSETNIPETFPHDVNLCYTDFFRSAPKRTGVEKPQIYTIFVPSRRQLAQ